MWSCAGFVGDVERVRIAGSTLHHSLCGCCVAGLICCEAGAREGDTVTSCHLPSARRCSRCSTCPSARLPRRTRAMLYHAMTQRQVMVSFAVVCGRVGGCSSRVTWCCRALGLPCGFGCLRCGALSRSTPTWCLVVVLSAVCAPWCRSCAGAWLAVGGLHVCGVERRPRRQLQGRRWRDVSDVREANECCVSAWRAPAHRERARGALAAVTTATLPGDATKPGA